jgi:hypothetical protein
MSRPDVQPSAPPAAKRRVPWNFSLRGDAAAANRLPAWIAAGSGVLAMVGAFQTWLRLRISGVAVRGGAETGWDGRDGKTVAVAAVVALVVAGLLKLGHSDLWLDVSLFVVGAVTVVVTIVNVADATSKAHDIENEFGIAAVRVQAQVGLGLWLVGIAGCGMLTAGLLARRSGT